MPKTLPSFRDAFRTARPGMTKRKNGDRLERLSERRPDERNAAPQGGVIHETCRDTCTCTCVRRCRRVRAHGRGCGRAAGAEIRDRPELAEAAAEQLDLRADRRHLR